jgi:dipeptidyl aminopeptidase/acylaminoacyl peptidase
MVFTARSAEPIRLANHPALSPDGKTLAFDWNGDIWTVPTAGGVARPLTSHPAKDTSPVFSPDGKEIAFLSEREGVAQVFVMPAEGGTPKQMTFHSQWTAGSDRAAGYTLYEWLPDGKGWLVGTQWDNGWSRRNNDRLQIVRRSDDPEKRTAPELVFDDYAQNGTLSPDGKTVLFNREGPAKARSGGGRVMRVRRAPNSGASTATRRPSTEFRPETMIRGGRCGGATARSITPIRPAAVSTSGRPTARRTSAGR